MKALLDSHSTALDNVEGEDGITVRKNWKGGLTISGAGGVASVAAAYDSFFKVYAEGTAGAFKVGVRDGAPFPSLPEGICGQARVNSFEDNVEGHEEAWDTLDTEQTHAFYAILFCWVDAVLGPGIEVIVIKSDDVDPIAPVRADPMPEHIVSRGRLMLGRAWAIYDDEAGVWAVRDLIQDYKQGGTAQILLQGPCGNDVDLYIPAED